jgi:anti-sigma-K factor RskA
MGGRERDRDRLERQLDAYHDGELRGLARWRLERRLRRDPQLRLELERLDRIAAALREAGEAAPGPDLWDRIALRLPAADAERAEVREALRDRGRRRWVLAVPLGGAAAAAVAALVVFLGRSPSPPASVGVVRWMSAGKRSVFVREEPGPQGATIIWILHEPSETAARRRAGDVV